MSQDEEQPLIRVDRDDSEMERPQQLSPLKLLAQNNVASPWAVIAQGGLVVWLATVWTVILSNPAGLFTYHPLLQSVAIILFAQGILVLQPTRTANAKRTGLLVHEIVQITASLAIIAGASVIISNKVLHNADHFTTWHGQFGILSVILVVLQTTFGAVVGFEWGRKLIGGDAKARRLWKYHRFAGYLLFACFSVTALTALKADWVTQKASARQLDILNAAFAVGLIGLAGRVSLKKMFP